MHARSRSPTPEAQRHSPCVLSCQKALHLRSKILKQASGAKPQSGTASRRRNATRLREQHITTPPTIMCYLQEQNETALCKKSRTGILGAVERAHTFPRAGHCCAPSPLPWCSWRSLASPERCPIFPIKTRRPGGGAAETLRGCRSRQRQLVNAVQSRVQARASR